MDTFVELFFAVLAIAVFILFLPEIIGLGVILASAFYLVAFVTGVTRGR